MPPASAADALEKPRLWILGHATGDARPAVDQLLEHGKATWLQYDNVANELSRELVIATPNALGQTSSLHALSTDDQQAFHIHLPHTLPGTVIDAAALKEPASHRVVFAITGKEPGKFEWADAHGPIAVTRQHNISIAKGAVSDTGYAVTIPPYSMVAIELMGGIHHFHNIRALSYHPLNEAVVECGDNITLNTQQWHGDLPQHWQEVQPEHVAASSIQTAQAFHLFMQRAYQYLKETTKQHGFKTADQIVAGIEDAARDVTPESTTRDERIYLSKIRPSPSEAIEV